MCVWVCLVGTCNSAHARDDDFFAPDKSLHFSISAAAAFGCYLALDALPLTVAWRELLAWTLPLSLGFGKEFVDFARGGRASRADLAWDIFGVASGLLLGCLVRTCWQREELSRSPPG
jgi:uncharacterized protein YfiM (DUF2279 family)